MVEEFNKDIYTITNMFENVKRENDYGKAKELYSLCSKTYEKYETTNDYHLIDCFKSFLSILVQILFFIQYTNQYQNSNTLENNKVKRLERKE